MARNLLQVAKRQKGLVEMFGRLRFATAAVAAASVLAITAPASRANLIGQLTVANADLATQGAGPYASYNISGTTAGGVAGTFTGWTAKSIAASHAPGTDRRRRMAQMRIAAVMCKSTFVT